jgi:hypothetical protein
MDLSRFWSSPRRGLPVFVRNGKAPRGIAASVATATSLTILAAFGFGSHILMGGFYWDDWTIAGAFHYGTTGGHSGFAGIDHIFPRRPLLSLVLSASQALFGVDQRAQFLWALLLTVSVAVLVARLLSQAGLAPQDAGIIAALGLVFPWTTGTTLWVTAANNYIALLLLLTGVLFATRPPGRTWMRNVARLLFFLSILVYQAFACLVFLVPLLDRGQPGRTGLLRRTAADVGAVAAGVAFTYALGETELPPPIRALPGLGAVMARDTLRLMVQVFVPFGQVDLQILVLLGVLAVGLGAFWVRRPLPPSALAAMSPWVSVMAVGAIAIVLSYVPFLGTGLSPLSPGVGNRINAAAAFGFGAVLYGLARLFAEVLSGSSRRVTAALTSCILLVYGVTYEALIRSYVDRWNAARTEQAHVLGALRADGADQSTKTVYVVGFPAETAPGVPVFLEGDDATGAVQVLWGRRHVNVYPVFRGSQLRCGPSGLDPFWLITPYRSEGGYARGHGGDYGATIVVDISDKLTFRPRSYGQCQHLLRKITSGKPPIAY